MLAPSTEVSRHKCLIYEGHPSEQLPVIAPLLIDGLRENRRCLYLGDPETVEKVRAALGEKGVDVRAEIAKGALVFSSERDHLAGGDFDPAAMVADLGRMIDAAVRDGFSGLWATGDMRWELGEDRNFARLRDYEARLELLLRDKPLAGVCQYHRDVLPARAIEDALLSHRSVYLGSVLSSDNVFYVPPELLLKDGPERRDERADWMWRQMTRLLRAERQRDESLQALAALNKELEDRVRQRTADLEAFSYSVSHDLRAPLRAIDGFCRVILREHAESMTSAARHSFSRVVDSAQRMSGLIDALLELFDLSRRSIEPHVVDMSRLAEGVAAELRAADPARRVDVVIAPGLATRGDPRLLASALGNLLGNAWKFTSRSAAPRIEFGSRWQDGGRVFYVRDNGAGFDAARYDRLFKPFSRLHGLEYPGHGLGLAIVARVLALHGGAVWAESSPGAGATFFFTLPDAGRR